jgi:hypothetical protein
VRWFLFPPGTFALAHAMAAAMQLAPRARAADTRVMVVADLASVAERDNSDRRQSRAALLGLPDAQPAAARSRAGLEGMVERVRAAGLGRAGDRFEWDLPHAARTAPVTLDG